jgi:MFS family permease
MDHHHYHLHKIFNKELSELYASYTIRAFALALISIFIPVYLLKLGYPLSEVFLFYLLFDVFGLAMMFLATKLVEKIGLKHCMVLSSFLTIAMLLLLFGLKNFQIPLFIISIVFMIGSMFYWIPFHLDFCKSSDKKERGMEYAIVSSISSVFVATAPFVGALIINKYGFSPLYIIGCVLIFVAMIPLFFTKDLKEKHKLNFKNFLKSHKKYAKYLIAESTLSRSALVVWPIYIYLTLESVMSLGIIQTAMRFILAAIPLFIGPLIDRSKNLFVLKIGAYGNSVTFLIRGFLTTFFQIFVLNLFAGVFMAFRDTGFFVTFYNKANKVGAIRLVMLREFYLRIGRGGLMLILFILALKNSSYIFLTAFIITALSSIIVSRFK